MGQAPPPAVALRAAVCVLDRFPALAGLDFEVARGEIVVVGGANGAGKTTLLRALAGLVPVIEGEAIVLGHDLRRHRRAVRTHVGLLGHGSCLYDDLTVVENATFWGRAARRPAAAVEPALARMGVASRLAHLPVGRLSAGQRARVALAVLAVRDPRLWLLDEPHASLDATGRAAVDELVGEAARGGATVILASHDPEAPPSWHARAVTLAGGRVRAPGTEGPGGKGMVREHAGVA